MWIVLVAIAVVLSSASSVRSQQSNLPLVDDLTGKGWTITNGNGSMTLDSSVPGYALEALQAAGKVGNPLERYGVHTRHGSGPGPPVLAVLAALLCYTSHSIASGHAMYWHLLGKAPFHKFMLKKLSRNLASSDRIDPFSVAEY